jgi:hypothetical protein
MVWSAAFLNILTQRGAPLATYIHVVTRSARSAMSDHIAIVGPGVWPFRSENHVGAV